MTAITKIALRGGLLIALVVLLAVAVLVQGKGPGITFATGSGFNLKIDSEATYNGASVPAATWDLKNLLPGVDKFFNFDDIKPGDSGENTISLHVNKDAWACLEFTNLQDKENGRNEPEMSAGDTSVSNGELAEGLEFFAWRDDGDNVFEVGEQPLFGSSTQSATVVLKNTIYALADFGTGSPLSASSTRYVGIAWCAGNLSVNVGQGQVSCDGSVLGNIAQTDSMSVDVSVRAVPVSEQPKFKCKGESGGHGLGEEIGLFVKCKTIATYGWPLPSYKTECPNGFGASDPSASATQNSQLDTTSDRDRTRTERTR